MSMPNTLQLSLPLLDAAQAQKHVTVNEALVRLDAAAQMVVETRDLTSPPVNAVDGQAFLVAPGADGDWDGWDGRIAIRVNGGWEDLVPRAGWRLWVADRFCAAVFDGTEWIDGLLATAPGGSATRARIIETDHVLSAGPDSRVAAFLPAGASVLGVSGRVTTAIGGATSWSVGVSDSPDRYGSGLGVARNSFLIGLTGQPQAYYSPTDLVLTAVGGDFTAGTVRLAVHLSEIVPPRAI